jgi:DNA mismatch repair ATPase MutS
MDEVGRGTTVKDGLAISFATLHHLASINKSRCLFATHFHELANMVSSDSENEQRLFNTVRFYCSDINDTEVSLYSINHLWLANIKI